MSLLTAVAWKKSNPPIMGKIAMNGSIRTATMKRHKCMADGGVIEQTGRKVRQAVGGIADFLHIGKPAETIRHAPPRRDIPQDQPIVPADTRPDMPQERNPRRLAEEVDQRKQARSGGYARGGIIPVQGIGSGTSDSIPVVLAGHEVKVSNGEGVAVLPAKTMRTPGALDAVEGIIAATNKKPPQPRTGGATGYQTGVAGLVDDTANRIVQAPAMQPSAAQGILAGVRDFAAPLAPSMGPNLAASAAPPGTGQSQGFIGGADYRGGPDKNVGFVWPDGTPRVQPGQQGAVAPVAKAPGLMTMKEKDIAAGLDPNRAYRAGSAGDPYSATGGIAAAAQGRGPVPVADAGGSQAQMLDAVPGRRRGRRAAGYAQGGIMAWLPEGGHLKDAESAQATVSAVKNAPAIGAPLTIYGGPKPITAQQLYGSAPPVNDPQQRLIEGQGLRPDAGLTGPRAGSQSFKMLRQPETEALPVVAAPKPAQQPIAATYSNEGRPSAIQAANAVPASDRTGIDTLPSGIVSANMGRGFDPTKLQMADGYGAATNASGKTLFVSPGQYRAADGSTTADWRQTQEYKDAIDRNAADKLRLAEMQAQRQGRDPVATLAASRGIADAVLNAPIERQAKQAQAQTAQQQAATGKIAVQQAQELNDLYAAHQAATTPAEQGRIAEMIRVRTGKDKPDEYAHASGGTTVNPTTMAVEKTPDVIYNRRTGQTQVAGQPSASQPKQAPQSAIDALRANPALAAQFQQKYGYLPQKP